METAKVMLTNLQSFFLGHTKGLLVVLLHVLASVYKTAVTVYFSQEELVVSSDRENRPPSSLLVPLPFQLRVDSTKEQIPVLKWSEILRKLGSHNDQDVKRKRCAVCLTCMKELDEVREIQSCFHVFHKECLDAWIDKGKVTCPLCRTNMLSEEKFNSCGVDPWRRERMLYLFGEDIAF